MSPALRAVILGKRQVLISPPCGVLRLRDGPAARFRAADGRPNPESQGAGPEQCRPRPPALSPLPLVLVAASACGGDRVRALVQQDAEGGLVEDRDAELDGLVVLGARVLARHHEA